METEGVVRLFVVVCDRQGRILCVSPRARRALVLEEGRLPLANATFHPLLERGPYVFLGVRLGDLEWDESATALFRKAEARFLRHGWLLAGAERKLSSRARQGRGGGRIMHQLEAERRRIARELHGGVGQLLAAIRLQTEVIEAHSPEPALPVRQAGERISRLAQDALEQVRALSRRLRPPTWQTLTLESAIRQLWELSGIPQRFESSLRIEPLPAEPDLEVKSLFYRTAQEAFSNLSRHSKATRVEVALEQYGDSLILSVVDNGAGFDAEKALREPANLKSGIGLPTIREDAAAMGAKLEVQSGPNGTRLTLSARAASQGLAAA